MISSETHRIVRENAEVASESFTNRFVTAPHRLPILLQRLNSAIVYDRDFSYNYFGFKTLERSYLLKIGGKGSFFLELQFENCLTCAPLVSFFSRRTSTAHADASRGRHPRRRHRFSHRGSNLRFRTFLNMLWSVSDVQSDVREVVHARQSDAVQRGHVSSSVVELFRAGHAERQHRGHLRHSEAVRGHLEVRGRNRTERALHSSHWRLHRRRTWSFLSLSLLNLPTFAPSHTDAHFTILAATNRRLGKGKCRTLIMCLTLINCLEKQISWKIMKIGESRLAQTLIH